MLFDLHRLAPRLAIALVLFTTLAASISLHRWHHYWLLAFGGVLVACVIHARQRHAKQETDCTTSPIQLAFTCFVVVSTTLALHRTSHATGHILPLNMDLGYFAQLAHTLPEAGVASFWSAALGPATPSAGETSDLWYHWGPIFLTTLFSQVTGLSALKTLLWVVTPLLNILLVLVGAALVSRITRWTAGLSLLTATMALIALPFPSMGHAALLMKLLPTDIHPHIHVTLASQFSYKFEGILILAALHAWLGRRFPLALGLLFAASISSPHMVALAGLTAGILGCHALITRNRQQIGQAAAIIAISLLAWMLMKLCFGVGLPKMEDSALIDLRPMELLKNTTLGLTDLGFSAALSILLLPGLIHLWRQPEGRLPALLSFSALIGSHLAYRLLLPDGDRAHFTMLAHAVLIVPFGTIGLAMLVWNHRSRSAAAALIVVTFVGVYEVRSSHRFVPPTHLTTSDIATLSSALQGRPFGYFASTDRNWWISQHAVLAGHLNTRCLRLNKLHAVDEQSGAARFYGSSRIEHLVPRQINESDATWSLRLARATGIQHLMQFPEQELPAGIKPSLQQVAQAGGHVLWEITPTVR